MISGTLPQLSVHVNEDKVSTLKRMSNMLKRDYETWTTPSATLTTAAAPIPTENSTETEGDETDDIFSAFDGQKDVDESSKLFYLYFCIADLSLELQSRGSSVAQFQIDGLKASYTRRPFDSSVVFSLQNLYLVDTMPIHSTDHISSRHMSSEGSPRSPASPDPSFRPSKKNLLDDRSKILVSLTSTGKRSDEKPCEAAKVDILTIDHNCPKFKAGLLESTHRFVDVNFCRLDILFSLQTWVIVFDFFGIGSGGIPKTTEQNDPVDKKNVRRRGRSRRRPTLPQQDPPSRNNSESQEPECFNTEIDIKVRALSVVLNKPEYELACASATNYVSKVHLKNGNFSIEGTLGDFALKDLTPHGVLYRDRFLSRGEHVLKFHFFKFGTQDDKLLVIFKINFNFKEFIKIRR